MDNDNAGGSQEGNGSVSDPAEVVLNAERIEEINLDFKHLYWSRLIVVDQAVEDSGQNVQDRKHALAHDIIEELQALATDNVVDDSQAEWKPHFDPDEFTKAN